MRVQEGRNTVGRQPLATAEAGAHPFGEGLLDTADSVLVRDLQPPCRGRGVVAQRAFASSETIASDRPLAALHLGSSGRLVQACAHCFRYLGTLQGQFAQLAGRNDEGRASGAASAPLFILPGLSTAADSHLSRVHPCRNKCVERYCSAQCEAAAHTSHHALLCPLSSERTANAREACAQLRAHAHSNCEAFMLAAKLIAMAFSGKCGAARRGIEKQIHMLAATAPWWELVAIPEDVPTRKHPSYRRKLRAQANRALSLTAAILRPASPPGMEYLLTLDHYGLLLAAILQNSICIELPNPARQYLEAQVHRNVAEDVVLLAPLAQEVLQFQGALEKEEEDADGISLDDGSSEEEEQEDEEGSDEEGSDGSVAERSRTLTDGAVTAPEAVELLEAAIAVVPDIEASGVFPLLSFINHSCTPNASVEFPGPDGLTAEIVAARDILEGEELRISYIDSDEMELKERQQELWEYQFQCDCQRCVSDRAATGVTHHSGKRGTGVHDGEMSRKKAKEI